MASAGRYPGLGYATGVDPLAPPDVRTELNGHLEVLAGHSFPTANWTPEAIYRLPMTVARFCSTVKIITGVADPLQRSNVLSLGVIQDYYAEARSCTLPGIVGFCDYLRTPAGQAAMRAKQFRMRLERRGVGRRGVAGVALLSAAQHQLAELSTEEKLVRADFEAKMVALQRQMQTCRAEEEVALADLKRRFKPVASYVPISGDEFTRRCFDAYSVLCSESHMPARPMSKELIADAKVRFGPAIKDEHLLEFISEKKREKSLVRWINRKIRFFDGNFNTRRAWQFRQLLAAASGSAIASVPAEQDEQSSPLSRTSGDGQSGDGRSQGEAELPAEVRVRSQRRRSSGKKRKSARAKAGDSSSHPAQPQ